MIKVKLLFSTPEAIQIFKNAGLQVGMRDFPIRFENPHGDGGRTEQIPIMAVINPHTGVPEELEKVFKKYLDYKKSELFLKPENIEIYNLFER